MTNLGHISGRSDLDRRSFLKIGSSIGIGIGIGIGVGATSILPKWSFAAGDRSMRPHYLLQILVPGGLDANYLFDARPLAMTADGVIANYLGEDPKMYVGTNGQSTLATSLTEPLMKWRDHFTVINGVVMAATFDGHDQNLNMLLTGNPFGGDSYLPWMNDSISGSNIRTPMDYVQNQEFYANLTNGGGSLRIDPNQVKVMSQRVAAFAAENQPALKYMISRARAGGQGHGSLSASSRRYLDSLGGVSDLARRISSVELKEDPSSGGNGNRLGQTKADIEMLCELFRAGITRAGVLVLADDIDSHDVKSAKELKVKIKGIVEALSTVFEYLGSKQSADGRSMLDDTTIVFASEFSRTMRQADKKIDETGTDHNPLNNSIILAGRGIRGGQVIGASDFESSEEVLSPAHLTIDPKKLKIMGRPFDHATGKPRMDAAVGAYNPDLYLTSSHVANTLQQILGMDVKHRFTPGRDMAAFPSIPSLIG